MKDKIYFIKKNSNYGFVGIEAAIISALVVTFSIVAYNYLLPSFEDIAVSIKNSVSGIY